MKIVLFVMAIIIMLIIPSMLTLSRKIDELRKDLNKSNDSKNELEKRLNSTEKKFTFYKDELENRIAKFNDNAYKYKEEVKNEFDSVNNNIKSIKNNNKNFAMQLGRLRNDYAEYLEK